MMTTETDFIATSPTSTTTDLSAVAAHVNKMASTDRMSYRKTTKPMMEKKRRARINHCLTQLKSLVLQAMKKDNSQYSKLEKADILELTVKHLKNVQRMQASTNSSSSQIPTEAFSKYRAGFNECANEVVRYLGESQGLNNEARTRILSHLSNILSPVNSLSLQQTSSAQIVPNATHVLPGHAPILPAPIPANQLHQQQQLHNLNLQLQHSNINNTLTLLQQHQQHQELSQNVNHSPKSSLQNELQQRQNQQLQHQPTHIISSGSYLGGHHCHNTLSVSDLNNNNVINISNNNNNNNNNLDEVINRNIINTPTAHGSMSNNNSNCNQIPTTSHNQTSRSNILSQQNMNFVDSSREFKSQSTSSASVPPSSFHLPCIATPASMATTTPFQLVHSTLPNGQIALVLAPTITPQTLSGVNVHPTHPNSMLTTNMAAFSNQNQPTALTVKQEQCPSKSPLEIGQLQQLSRPLTPDSRGQNQFMCQENPISLVVNKSHERINEENSLNNNNKANLNTEYSRIPHEHVSTFSRTDSSLNLSNSSTTSSSLVSSSVIKSTSNTSYNANVCQNQLQWQQKQLQQSGARSSVSPPSITDLTIGDNDSRCGQMDTSTTQPMSREVVRCPEDVTSKRDLFEYKMAKSKSRTRSQEESLSSKGKVMNDGNNNTWRPW